MYVSVYIYHTHIQSFSLVSVYLYYHCVSIYTVSSLWRQREFYFNERRVWRIGVHFAICVEIRSCIHVFPSASACIRGCFRLHPGVSQRIGVHPRVLQAASGCFPAHSSALSDMHGNPRLHPGVSQRIGVHPRVLQAASWCFPAHRHASADAYWRTIMHCALFMLLLIRMLSCCDPRACCSLCKPHKPRQALGCSWIQHHRTVCGPT